MSGYLYFQPEYVRRFQCDGAKCPNSCCARPWYIELDAPTREKYLQAGLGEYIKFNADYGKYLIALDEHERCPFLNEDKLCSLQLKYGEDFLSDTCTTYPRYTKNFGKFFERALTLSCPIAAEMILFAREPMKFEFVEVPEKIHSHGGKIGSANVAFTEGFAEHMLEIQIAMISILQERTLTINQRLTVLGFFLDRLDELIGDGRFTAQQVPILIDNLQKLTATYESKKFLTSQVPLLLASVTFDAKKFIKLMLEIFETLYSEYKANPILMRVAETLHIKPDENNFVSVEKVVAAYESLAAERKIFAEKYSAFLENYLVNEIFIWCYPWLFNRGIANDFACFVTIYKVFELVIFSATRAGFDSKDDLLKIVDWFATFINHSGENLQNVLKHVENRGDILDLIETLIEQ